MSNLSFHLLQSGIGIALFYVAYWFLLRNLKWFSFNRMLIITFLLLAVLLPFVSLPGEISAMPLVLPSVEMMHTAPAAQTVQPDISNASGVSILSILSIIYISGATFFLLRFLYSLLQLAVMYVGSSRVRKGGFIIVLQPGEQSPFAFFNLLFVSEAKYRSEKFNEILMHESVHRGQWHSLDIIILELISIVQWFNPFVWLFRRALKSQHEYLADRGVIEKGVCRLSYQKILFEESVGVALNLTSNFNYSLLKQRLKMMTLEKTKKRAYVRYLLLAPMVIMVSFFLLGHSGKNSLAGEPLDVLPEYKEGQQALMLYLQSNLRYPQSARAQNLQTTVYVNFEVDTGGKVGEAWVAEDATGADVILEQLVVVAHGAAGEAATGSRALEDLQAETLRVVKGMGDFTPAQRNESPVKAVVCLPVRFAIQ